MSDKKCLDKFRADDVELEIESGTSLVIFEVLGNRGSRKDDCVRFT